MRAICATTDQLPERSCVRNRPDLPFAADTAKPFLPGIATSRARSHHHLMASLNEFCGERIAHHAGAENPDFHKISSCDLFAVFELRNCESAIEGQRLTGCECRVATEPEHRRRDFLRRAAAAHRVHVLEGLRQVRGFIEHALIYLGVNSARTDGLHA